MRTCPACYRSVPDSAMVCPYPACGKLLSASPHPAIKRPPPPGPVHMSPPGRTTPDAVLKSRPATAFGRLWRSLGLAIGSLLAFALVGGVWYVAAVVKYAQLDPGIRLVRDAKSPQKLLLEYHPLSGGQVTARCDAAGQELEMLKQLPPDRAGSQEQTELAWSGIQPGDVVRVTFRDGWWKATKELTVPDSPHRVAKVSPPATTEPPSEAKPRATSDAMSKSGPLAKSDPTVEAEPLAKTDLATKVEPAMPVTIAGAAEPELAGSKPVTVDETLAAVKSTPAEPTVVAADPPTKSIGLYSVRTLPNREKLLPQLGGTPESEQAVAAGLAWLARHQALDGHWGPDCLGAGAESRCEQDHPCTGPAGGEFEGAYTGLAVLAFQAGGHYYFNRHQYSENVTRGLDIMVSNQGLAGELVGSQNHLAENPDETSSYNVRYMYEHAMGTFALAEACATAKAAGQKPNQKYLAAAIKAVRFIESQQHDDGGWRYTPKKEDPCDCSVSGWVMLALKTALEAEIKVNPETIYRMVQFFKAHADQATGRTHYQLGGGGTDALTGVGMMLDEFILHDPHSQLVQLAAPYLAGQADAQWGAGLGTGLSDFYTWYNCTLAMFQAGGDPWNRWNSVVRDHLQKLQIGGAECPRGSWDPNTSRWGSAGGRIYTTALGVLTLEVYYRFAREQAKAK